MKKITITLPTIEQIGFTIECLEEFEHPNDSFALDAESQEEIVNKIIKDLESGNQWAWCYVRVRGEYKGIIGEDGLGCCSYESEADFKSGGCFEDMKDSAYNQIIEKLEALA
jgi:hypothetical protein